jgi:hypothetical protein
MFVIVNEARFESNSLGHDWFGCEHLLLGLLHLDDPAAQGLTAHGITLDDARAEVVRLVGARAEPTTTVAPFTRDAERVMEAAGREASLDNRTAVEPMHLLHALLAESDGTDTCPDAALAENRPSRRKGRGRTGALASKGSKDLVHQGHDAVARGIPAAGAIAQLLRVGNVGRDRQVIVRCDMPGERLFEAVMRLSIPRSTMRRPPPRRLSTPAPTMQTAGSRISQALAPIPRRYRHASGPARGAWPSFELGAALPLASLPHKRDGFARSLTQPFANSNATGSRPRPADRDEVRQAFASLGFCSVRHRASWLCCQSNHRLTDSLQAVPTLL